MGRQMGASVYVDSLAPARELIPALNVRDLFGIWPV